MYIYTTGPMAQQYISLSSPEQSQVRSRDLVDLWQVPSNCWYIYTQTSVCVCACVRAALYMVMVLKNIFWYEITNMFSPILHWHETNISMCFIHNSAWLVLGDIHVRWYLYIRWVISLISYLLSISFLSIFFLSTNI